MVSTLNIYISIMNTLYGMSVTRCRSSVKQKLPLSDQCWMNWSAAQTAWVRMKRPLEHEYLETEKRGFLVRTEVWRHVSGPLRWMFFLCVHERVEPASPRFVFALDEHKRLVTLPGAFIIIFSIKIFSIGRNVHLTNVVHFSAAAAHYFRPISIMTMKLSGPDVRFINFLLKNWPILV